jgi:hypothetical protein
MTEKSPPRTDRVSGPQCPAAATTTQDEVKDSTTFKVKKFTKETNKNTDCGKYEPFNVLNENGDSIIYTANSNELEKRGQFYIINIVDIIEELGDQIKSLQKGQALLRKDLVNAGVLKAV